MNNPIKSLSKKEICLWILSILIIILSNTFSSRIDLLTIIAACIGITSLVFAAKGNAWAQILMIIFAILYSIISYRLHYYGEMITYLGMSLPMAIFSAITWFKNSSGDTVKIEKISLKKIILVISLSVPVTIGFYFILKALNTPNLLFSTISITTSFLASTFTLLRTSLYAVGYALNDLVLIVLWVLASIDDLAYLPVVLNFVIFFFNDLYGFFSWRKRESN